MSVEALLQALLIHVMADETDASSQDEQRVDGANVDVLLSFLARSSPINIFNIQSKTFKDLPRESAAISQHVDEAGGNDTVDIQDQVRLLAGCDLLNLQSVFKHGLGREVLQDEFLDDLHTNIRIIDGLDAVTDAHDQLTLLAHGVNEFHRVQV